jgi:hypothetical protein
MEKYPPVTEEAVMRKLFTQDGETTENARRRELIEAPYGRCGDLAGNQDSCGCGAPLERDEQKYCSSYPGCVNP